METAASLPLQHHGTRIRFVAIGLDLGSPADKKKYKIDGLAVVKAAESECFL